MNYGNRVLQKNNQQDKDGFVLKYLFIWVLVMAHRISTCGMQALLVVACEI